MKASSSNRRAFLKSASAVAVVGPITSVVTRRATAHFTTKDKIKVGQIGTGHAHARGKLQALQLLNDDYEIVGVVENDPLRRKQLGDSYLGVKLISEQQLLNTSGLKMVAVETEVPDLVPTAQRCIKAGVHVHLDKPAGESLAAYRRLLDDATRQQLTIQMGYIYRYHPAIRFCVDAMQKGWLGDVFEVDTVISKTIDARTRQQLAQFAGGTMFELGCHVIDVVVWLLGKPDKVTPFVRRTKPQQDALADNQLAVFEYPGATATVRSAMIEVRGQDRRQLVVCGDRGTFDLRPLNDDRFRLALDQDRGKFKKGYQQVDLPGKPRRYVADFVELAAVIRQEKSADFSAEHDLAVHQAVLQASGY